MIFKHSDTFTAFADWYDQANDYIYLHILNLEK